MKAKLNANYVAFSGIAVMTLYVLWHNERFLIEPENPIWDHYAQIHWSLLPHGIFGAMMLLLAPLQFSERRKHSTKTVLDFLAGTGAKLPGAADHNKEQTK